MRPLIFTILILFLNSLWLSAQPDSYEVDLNNDQKDEVITVEQKFELLEDGSSIAKGAEIIISADGNKIGNFSMPNEIDKVEFVSLSKDGLKQIVAWSSGRAHYTNIAIYGYPQGIIFRNGGICLIEADFEAEKPIIKVGRADWGRQGWRFSKDEPLWQAHVWDGNGFVFNKELSTTDEIGEEEEIARYVEKVRGLTDRVYNKIEVLMQGLEGKGK